MIVVTAPTGNIGQQVVERLLDSGEPMRVIARDPFRLSLQVHGRLEVVEGSHGDRGIVSRAHAGLVTASLAMDDLIAGTGVSYRSLTMPSFMDNILRQVGSIRERGLFSLPIDGDRKLPACATRDIAPQAFVMFKSVTLPSMPPRSECAGGTAVRSHRAWRPRSLRRKCGSRRSRPS